jgi:hypothetical protein
LNQARSIKLVQSSSFNQDRSIKTSLNLAPPLWHPRALACVRAIRKNRPAAEQSMRYLIWGSVAATAIVLVLWYEASGIVDNYSVAGILAAVSCMVVLLVNRRMRRS